MGVGSITIFDSPEVFTANTSRREKYPENDGKKQERDDRIMQIIKRIWIVLMVTAAGAGVMLIIAVVSAHMYCLSSFHGVECSKCGTLMSAAPGTHYCTSCGADAKDLVLVEERQCLDCGRNYSYGSTKFCQKCGGTVDYKKTPLDETTGIDALLFHIITK